MNGAPWQTTAQGRKFRDPLRVILHVDAGSGTDTLTLECGHEIVKNHTSIWGRRTGCTRCREWEDEL
jgi:hypothetical protein